MAVRMMKMIMTTTVSKDMVPAVMLMETMLMVVVVAVAMADLK